MMLPTYFVALLACWIFGVVGLKLLSKWKKDVKEFVGLLAAILAIAVAEIGMILFYPSASSMFAYVDILTVCVGVVGIGIIYHRRFPKIDLETAERQLHLII